MPFEELIVRISKHTEIEHMVRALAEALQLSPFRSPYCGSLRHFARDSRKRDIDRQFLRPKNVKIRQNLKFE